MGGSRVKREVFIKKGGEHEDKVRVLFSETREANL